MYRQDLTIDSPCMNAAGTLGFAPPSRWPISEPMGAFLTNPISLGPRTPAGDRGLLNFPGGLLLHSGLPNPGLSRVLRKYGERWAQSALPIWVHLIGSNPDEIHQMVRRLEGQEGVMAIEVGVPPDARGNEALTFVDAALGELPVIAHLPLTAAGEAWLDELPKLGAAALSLGGPRGLLPSGTGRPVAGRLVGPALFPQMLAAVQSTRRIGIPIIAGSGVYRREDAQALRDAGAWAVQLDTVLWRGFFD
jgi:dihydroorotate dehydrogenase (NAD+) catalytic subunit